MKVGGKYEGLYYCGRVLSLYHGGVSSWVHVLTSKMPDTEFYIQALIVNREQSGKFLYALPDNVIEVREIYLQDIDWMGKRKK